MPSLQSKKNYIPKPNTCIYNKKTGLKDKLDVCFHILNIFPFFCGGGGRRLAVSCIVHFALSTSAVLTSYTSKTLEVFRISVRRCLLEVWRHLQILAALPTEI